MSIFDFLFKKEKPSVKREPKRIPVKIQVVVWGRNEQGVSFKEAAEIVNIRHDGGCLTCDQDMLEGAQLKLCTDKKSIFRAGVESCQYNIAENRRYVDFKLIDPPAEWRNLIHQSVSR